MTRWSVLLGDCIEQMRTLDEGSVHCCVTSPPYWGLRDYGVDGQIGLETTPAEYVARLVDVFDAVYRVLRDDGTLWLNLGDSYSTTPSGHCAGDSIRASTPSGGKTTGRVAHDQTGRISRRVEGLKPKDLVGVPWRVAFALRDAGWFLRSDIIWAKPNPMPESVTDRPTKAHEYVFLLAKRERYAYDAEAAGEPVSTTPGAQAWRRIFDPAKQRKEATLKAEGTKGGNDGARRKDAQTRNARTVWTIAGEPCAEAHFAVFPEEIPRRCILAGCPRGGMVLDPFTGSGTTGIAALKLGRGFVGCELNHEYRALACERIGAVAEHSSIQARRAGQEALFRMTTQTKSEGEP